MCGTPGAAQSHTWAPRHHRDGLFPECHHAASPSSRESPGRGSGTRRIPPFSTRNHWTTGNTRGVAGNSPFKNRASLYVLLLCFSAIQARVCLGASPRGSELHPTTEALLRQNKPLVVPSPLRVDGGDAGPPQSCWVGSPPHRDVSLSRCIEADGRMVEKWMDISSLKSTGP